MTTDKKQIAISIFMAGVESVMPGNLINKFFSIEDETLKIEKKTFNLSQIKNIYVVGAGKASAAMAQALESVLKSRITGGLIITKYNHSVPLEYIKICEAGHPVPDENGIIGTEKILSIVSKAEKDDLVICLISGGGSALMADVPEGCNLSDLKSLNNILLESGANINEMNCIRKHLSKVKGGQLAKAAAPATVVSIILSDVIGDPLDVIASGPTSPDPTTFTDAISIIRKYKIEKKIPKQIMKVLNEGFQGNRQENLKDSDEILLRTNNLIIGNNNLALKAAKEKAESLGYEAQIISDRLDGDVTEAAKYIIEFVRSVKMKKINQMTCLLFGGEPTVRVKGKGLGGRNQQLALIISGMLKDLLGVTFLSGGTDGSDGPTDAAGAVVDSSTSRNASDLGLDIQEYINNCNSYNYFKKAGGLIITGPTQTNVMDLMVVLIVS